MAVLLLADGGFEGDGVLRDFLYLAHAVLGHAHLFRDFPRGGFAAQLLQQNTRHPRQLVDRFDHVHGNTDRASLVGNRAGDGLTYPPGGVSGKFEALLIIELFHGLHQAEIALLDKVEKEHAAPHVPFGDGDDQAEVGFGKALFRRFVAVLHMLRQLNLLVGGKQGHPADVFQVHFDGIVQPDVRQRLLEQLPVALVLVHDLDAGLADRLIHKIDLVGAGIVLFQNIAERVGGNAAFHLVVIDDSVQNFVEFLFGYVTHFLSSV